MPGAVIVADQIAGAGLGTPGVSRNDLWVGKEVTLHVGTVGNTSYAWDLLDVTPGSGALIDSPATETCHWTPDMPGSYRIRLLTNGGGPGNVAIMTVRVRYDSTGVLVNRGWALPALGETEGENNYPGNTRSWAEAIEFIINDIRVNGVSTVSLAGDISGTSTANVLASIKGLLTRPSSEAVHGLFARITETIPFTSPRVLLEDGNEAWLSEHDALSNNYPVVRRVSLPSFAVVAEVDLSAYSTTGVRDLAQDASFIYAACWDDGHVVIISKLTNAVVGCGSLRDFGSPARQAVSVCADGSGHFYVLGHQNVGAVDQPGIYKFSTGACLGAAKDTVGPSLGVTAADWNGAQKVRYSGGFLWVANGTGTLASLTKVSPLDFSIVASSASVARADTVLAFGGFLFVGVVGAPSKLLQYDTDCALLQSWNLTVTTPSGIAANLAGSSFLVADEATAAVNIAPIGGGAVTVSALSYTSFGDVIFHTGTWFAAGFGPGGFGGVYSYVESVGPGTSPTGSGKYLAYGDVDQLQGRPVSAAAPVATQVLGYDGAQWAAADVTQLQGEPVDPAAPSAYKVLTYDGAKWTPSVVTRVQGVLVDSTAPVLNQILRYDGAKWTPQVNKQHYTYNLFSGNVSTQLLAATPLLIGSVYFDANAVIPTTSTLVRAVTFKVLVETTNAANAVNVQIYDKNGITGAVGLIASSLIGPKTDLTSTYYSVTVTDLNSVTTGGILECWLWMGAVSIVEQVTCTMAKLDVVWS